MSWRIRLSPLWDRKEKGVMRFNLHPADTALATDLFRRYREQYAREVEWAKGHGGELRESKLYLVAEIRQLREKRSLDQNSLLRALEHIMSYEQAGNDSLFGAYHEGLLEAYAPPMADEDGNVILNPITKRTVPMRSSQLDVGQFSRLIEGAFVELHLMGVGLESAQQIRNYWIEYRGWRKYQDALSYESLDEYRARQPFCEACVFATAEHLAHIWPRGLQGPDEPWNLLHLCPEHHVMAPEAQHEEGWRAFCTRFRHLLDKVNEARRKGQLGEITLEDAA